MAIGFANHINKLPSVTFCKEMTRTPMGAHGAEWRGILIPFNHLAERHTAGAIK
jgi:hypothetical protein